VSTRHSEKPPWLIWERVRNRVRVRASVTISLAFNKLLQFLVLVH